MTTTQYIAGYICIMFSVYGIISLIEDIAKFTVDKLYN